MSGFVHRLSLFRDARDTSPTCVGLTWDRFVEQLLPHEFRDDKLSCPAWSPAFYPEGATRKKTNVECASLWGGDYDAITQEQIERLIDLVIARGWSLVVYTTFSDWGKRYIDAHDNPSTERLYRVRFVLPLNREVSPDEWSVLWHAVNDELDSLSDPQCKDISRIYFGAYTPHVDEAFSSVFEGDSINVDDMLSRVSVPQTVPVVVDTAREPVSRARLQRFARALSRKRDERKAELGVLLLRVCNGESFAEPGSRDTTIYRMSLEIAQRFPECDANSIARHFGTSLALMSQEAPECPTIEDVAYKINRAQQEYAAERAQQEASDLAAQRQRIRDAFGTDRTDPYTVDEIKALGPSPRWIIQKGKSYYTLVGGEYRGPYSQDEALNAAIRDLSPASTAGVDLFTINAQGERAPKPLSRLIRDYGFVANDVAVDLSAQQSYFDESTRTIVEAPCPVRDIKAKHHPEIEAWLEALAGPDRLPLLLAWIANLTNLERPCTALFMTGPKSTGKSLAPFGWSRLWTALGFPTPLEDVLGTNFNDAQLRCPLTFADERLPTDHRGRVLNAELRHFIQAYRRPLRRKFLANADMIGAVRLVISANNEEVLATSETLSNNDIDAIVDRYLWIPCRSEAAEVLRSVDTSGWVEGDKIAEHALWLRDNYRWKPNGRFLVHSYDRELHSRLVSGSGIRSSVLQFCVGYLLDPARLDADPRGRFLIRVHDNRLCVNTQALVACWDTYVKNERCPSTGRLAGAIGALANDDRVRLTLPNGKRPNYRVIRPEHLKAWAARTGYATEEQIEEALSIDTVERGGPTLVEAHQKEQTS